MQTGWCGVVDGLWGLDPEEQNYYLELNRNQVERAHSSLTPDPMASRLRFAPDGLHTIARYLQPGQFWDIAANPGIGKTTFLLSAADDFLLAGKKVAILGLEQEDFELRTAFACLRAGVPRWIAIENSWKEQDGGQDMYERVHRQLHAQGQAPLLESLLLLPQRYIDVKVLVQAAKEAAAFGADVLIVDHLNHIRADSYNEFGKIVQLSKKIAEDYGFINLSASQVNREAVKGGHRLTRYMPAQLHHLYGGSVLEQNAVVVLNLYRPVMHPTTPAMGALIQAAMKGEIEATGVLQPNRMGVAVLKHRTRGELEGRRTILTLSDGKLVDTHI